MTWKKSRFDNYDTPFGEQHPQVEGYESRERIPSDLVQGDHIKNSAGALPYGLKQDIFDAANNSIINAKNEKANAVHVTDVYSFGDFIIVSSKVTTTSALVIPRTSGRRIYLMMQNNNAVGNVYFGFDKNVSATSGIAIPSFDFQEFAGPVPQNDIWLVSDQAGGLAITLMYCNA